MSTCIVAWYVILSTTSMSPGITNTQLTPIGFTNPMSCEFASQIYKQDYMKDPTHIRTELKAAGTQGFEFAAEWNAVNDALMSSPIK